MGNHLPTTAIATDGRCFLLAPPGELRNLIYLYTLHWEKGIRVTLDARKKSLCAVHVNQQDPPTLPNPLGAVCRQLQAETHGVIFKANDVDLRSHNFRYPRLYDLTQFTKHIRISATSGLRKLSITRNARPRPVVKLSYKETYEHAKGFEHFCIKHPKIVVVLRFDHVHIDDDTWLNRTIALKEIIYGPQVLPSNLRYGALVLVPGMLRAVGSTAALFRSLPPNLRFTVISRFPEAKERTKMPQKKVDDCYGDYIEWLSGWWEDGI